MKAKILNVMDEYLQSNPLFCRGGVKMVIFTWDSEPNCKGVKMTSERWQHHNVTFTQRSVGLLVKSVHFSNLCCIMCQWWPLKMGKQHFISQSSKACNSKALKILMPFRYWVLTNFLFGIFIFKALLVGPRDIGISTWLQEYIIKMYIFSVVKTKNILPVLFCNHWYTIIICINFEIVFF